MKQPQHSRQGVNLRMMNRIKVYCATLDHRGGIWNTFEFGLFYLRVNKHCRLCGFTNNILYGYKLFDEQPKD